MTNIFNRHHEKEKRRQLRQNMPEAEVILWSHLKGKTLGDYKFRRQYGIDRYVVDFYCPKSKLVIELDGDSHFTKEAMEYDKQREAFIHSLGIKIIRFTNLEIKKNLTEVLEVIAKTVVSFPSLRRRGTRRSEGEVEGSNPPLQTHPSVFAKNRKNTSP